jgi:uncharacterized membrane protein
VKMGLLESATPFHREQGGGNMTEAAGGRDEKDRWTPNLTPGRIEALTDGVFAIAMTILVLELSAPYLLNSPAPGEHPASFLDMWDEFYIYGLGFVVLGIYWILHRYMFFFIQRSDGVLIWLNILFLTLASLVPFSTKALSVNEVLLPSAQGESNAATGFFAITTMATILVLLAIWQYATRGYRLVDRDIDRRIIPALSKVILIGVVINAIGVVGSYFISWAGLIGFVAMVYMIIATAYGRYQPAGGRSESPKQA